LYLFHPICFVHVFHRFQRWSELLENHTHSL
jgi:hypothetical protein